MKKKIKKLKKFFFNIIIITIMTYDINLLKTGDLLLFNNNSTSGFFSILSSIIKYGSHSNYTHIGMVLKDPTFINKKLKGIYVWESGLELKPDPQDNKVKFGVQITPIEEMIESYKKNDGHGYVRKIICDKLPSQDNYPFSINNLKNIHNIVYDKPYDINPIDWIKELLGINNDKPSIDSFWCSAFVGYVYTKCGILNNKTNWSILTPSDFSLDGQNLLFENNNYLEENEYLLF